MVDAATTIGDGTDVQDTIVPDISRRPSPRSSRADSAGHVADTERAEDHGASRPRPRRMKLSANVQARLSGSRECAQEWIAGIEGAQTQIRVSAECMTSKRIATKLLHARARGIAVMVLLDEQVATRNA